MDTVTIMVSKSDDELFREDEENNEIDKKDINNITLESINRNKHDNDDNNDDDDDDEGLIYDSDDNDTETGNIDTGNNTDIDNNKQTNNNNPKSEYNDLCNGKIINKEEDYNSRKTDRIKSGDTETTERILLPSKNYIEEIQPYQYQCGIEYVSLAYQMDKEYDVYIGESTHSHYESIWANPWESHKDNKKKLKLYEERIRRRKDLYNKILGLRNKTIACW